MSENEIPAICKDVLHKTMPDGTVLVLKDGTFYRIDGASVDLFLAIDGKTSLRKIFTALGKKHGVAEEKMRTLTTPVVEKFLKFGVLTFH